MTSGRIGCELAVLALFCVLAIFLFPAGQGPYSVIHGPVTALLAARAALRVRISIVQAAMSSHSLTSPLAFLFRMPLTNSSAPSAAPPESAAILRC
jgi:hypothetical protein